MPFKVRFKKFCKNGHRTADLADDSTPVSTAEMDTLITQAILIFAFPVYEGRCPKERKGVAIAGTPSKQKTCHNNHQDKLPKVRLKNNLKLNRHFTLTNREKY